MNDIWANRQIDDYQRLCEGLIAEKNRVRKALENVAKALEAPPTTEVEEAIAIVIREFLLPEQPETAPILHEDR